MLSDWRYRREIEEVKTDREEDNRRLNCYGVLDRVQGEEERKVANDNNDYYPSFSTRNDSGRDRGVERIGETLEQWRICRKNREDSRIEGVVYILHKEDKAGRIINGMKNNAAVGEYSLNE